MRKLLLLSIAVIGSALLHAQTHFYIDQIVVQPAAPTADDGVFLDLIGNLSSTGAYVVSASAQTVGTVVTVSIVAADDGGLAVLVPHTETVQVGQLGAGTYTVVINGTFVGDFAPAPEHQFTVTAGTGPTCDDLQIASVTWHAFSDTAIVLHVLNNAPVGFNYPNFILYDTNGDTLAIEETSSFALANDSWHLLRIHPDATMPTEPFYGNIQLWTGFGDVLSCEWLRFIDLCPPGPCVTLIPTVQNLGGALAIGTYSWNILDDGFTSVAFGEFEMTDQIQYDTDTICMPPGNYYIAVAMLEPPTGGQPYYSVVTDGYISGPSAPVSFDLPVFTPFDFYLPCVDGTNGVAEATTTSGITVTQQGNGLLVRSRDGSSLGPIALHDASGRILYQSTVPADNITIPVSGASGLYLLRAQRDVRRVVLAD